MAKPILTISHLTLSSAVVLAAGCEEAPLILDPAYVSVLMGAAGVVMVIIVMSAITTALDSRRSRLMETEIGEALSETLSKDGDPSRLMPREPQEEIRDHNREGRGGPVLSLGWRCRPRSRSLRPPSMLDAANAGPLRTPALPARDLPAQPRTNLF
jgi:hypothetical protein